MTIPREEMTLKELWDVLEGCAGCGCCGYKTRREAKAALNRFLVESKASTRAAEARITQLSAEVKEWLCVGCKMVYQGPPQNGVWCVVCPKCNGDCGPKNLIEKLEAERQKDALAGKLKEAEQKIESYEKSFQNMLADLKFQTERKAEAQIQVKELAAQNEALWKALEAWIIFDDHSCADCDDEGFCEEASGLLERARDLWKLASSSNRFTAALAEHDRRIWEEAAKMVNALVDWPKARESKESFTPGDIMFYLE